MLTLSMQAGCSRKVEIKYPIVPPTLKLRATSTTTIGPDRTKETLLPNDPNASVPTTLVDFGEGTVTITGRVLGPDGPVPGATVRVERLVGSQTAERTIVSDAQGVYTLDKVPGGRLRLRAWKSPDIAMARNVVLFAKEVTKLDLQSERFASTDVRWAAAPSNPIEGQRVNFVVQVSRRNVNEDGVIGYELISGLAVKLVPLGALQPDGADERLTDDSGRASFPMRCNSIGPSGLRAQLASGEEASLKLPDCAPIPTTQPPTTLPPVTEPPTTIVVTPEPPATQAPDTAPVTAPPSSVPPVSAPA